MKSIYLAGAALAVLAQPASAQDAYGADAENDKAGFRVEARAMYEQPTVDGEDLFDDDETYELGSAFAFGGEAGLDFAVSDRVILGPYGTYEVSTVESCVDGDCLSVANSWSVGGHVGLMTGTRGMVYGKLGYTTLTIDVDLLIDGIRVQESESSGGFAAAVGFEQGFSDTLYGRLEAGYASIGEIYGLDWERGHVGVALGARF